MTAALGITGSTGNLGGRVSRLLAAEDVPMQLLVRDPSRAPALPGAAVAQAAYGDFEAVRRALDGLSCVLMVSGSESATRPPSTGPRITPSSPASRGRKSR